MQLFDVDFEIFRIGEHLLAQLPVDFVFAVSLLNIYITEVA